MSCPVPVGPVYPTVKAKTSARWAFLMEALRAPSEDGPRAALTWWGEPTVPEPGENGLDEEKIPSLLREPTAQWGEWALA